MFTAIDPKYAKTTLAIAAMCVVSAIVIQLFSVLHSEPGVANDWLQLVSGGLSGVCLLASTFSLFWPCFTGMKSRSLMGPARQWKTARLNTQRDPWQLIPAGATRLALRSTAARSPIAEGAFRSGQTHQRDGTGASSSLAVDLARARS